MTYYICARSRRNGALHFVTEYTSRTSAEAVAAMANQGAARNGPVDRFYVVLSSH